MTGAPTKRTVAACALAALLVLSPGSPVRALQADGASLDQAIMVDQTNERDGIAVEYEYLHRAYPEWRPTDQALLHQNGRSYDLLTLVSPTGEQKRIYFDITAFFGRL